MDDLQGRLHVMLEDLAEPVEPSPELRAQVGRRMRHRARRPLLVVIGAVAAAAVLLVVVLPLLDDEPAPRVQAAAPTAEPGTFAGAWEALPPGPVAPVQGQSAVWTGKELLVWGVSPDGAAYDPATRTWRRIAASPLSTRDHYGVVWAGDAMLVWGGVHYEADGSGYSEVGDGAAYDPAADTWTMLPPAPIAARNQVAAVWTGQEMIVWGGRNGRLGGGAGESFADGAAYDPATRRWRVLAPSPLAPRTSPAVVWTGRAVLVLGASGDGFGADGAAYDPAADRWRPVADMPALPSRPESVVWTGQEAIAVLANDVLPAKGYAYDPMSDRWRSLAPPPAEPWGSSVLAWTGAQVLAVSGGSDGGAYDPASGEWRRLPVQAVFPGGYPANAVWDGTALLVWTDAGGGAFVPGAATQPTCPTQAEIDARRDLAPIEQGLAGHQEYGGVALDRVPLHSSPAKTLGPDEAGQIAARAAKGFDHGPSPIVVPAMVSAPPLPAPTEAWVVIYRNALVMGPSLGPPQECYIGTTLIPVEISTGRVLAIWQQGGP